ARGSCRRARADPPRFASPSAALAGSTTDGKDRSFLCRALSRQSCAPPPKNGRPPHSERPAHVRRTIASARPGADAFEATVVGNATEPLTTGPSEVDPARETMVERGVLEPNNAAVQGDRSAGWGDDAEHGRTWQGAATAPRGRHGVEMAGTTESRWRG